MSWDKFLHINTKALHWYEGANIRSGGEAQAYRKPDIYSKVLVNGTVVHTSPTIKDVKEGDNPYWYVYNDIFTLPYTTEYDCI